MRSAFQNLTRTLQHDVQHCLVQHCLVLHVGKPGAPRPQVLCLVEYSFHFRFRVGRTVVRTRGRQGNAGAGSAKGAPPPRLPEKEAGCSALLEREAGCAGCTTLRHYAQARQHCTHVCHSPDSAGVRRPGSTNNMLNNLASFI